MTWHFVTTRRLWSAGRVRPITCPFSLHPDLPIHRPAHRRAVLHPKMPGEPMRVQPSRAKRYTSEDG
jgi:hypothetical protein